MVSLRNGTYTTVPISATREGVKRVDVDELYDADGVPAQGASRPRQADVPLLSTRTSRRPHRRGDCPGLNAAIRAVTRGLGADDHDVVGIRDGWRGLVDD